jgi:2'-5' RNA ligase
VAIELDAGWHEPLRAEEQRLDRAAPGLTRWVAPELQHLTLVFLGNQPAALIPSLTAALSTAAARCSAVQLSPGHLGSFGSPRALRVIWAGIEDRPVGRLGEIQGATALSLREAGVRFDEREFRAHITLGRVRPQATPSQSHALHQAVRASSDHWKATSEGQPPVTCRHLVLVRSDLRPAGPIYTVLHRASLASDSALIQP